MEVDFKKLKIYNIGSEAKTKYGTKQKKAVDPDTMIKVQSMARYVPIMTAYEVMEDGEQCLAIVEMSPTGEEPESSTVCRNDIIAMLSASGYHRARVGGLNDYDKIIGGIAWALTRCDDVEVAVNLLYEESEDQNIKLRTEQSEKIIEALQAVGCPHQLSAHQLFGLDFVSLKNVVQWLLRRMLAPQNEQKYKHFTDWFTQEHLDSEGKAMLEYRRRLKQNGNNPKTSRYMKRFKSSIIFDLTMDAKCTLAEYVVYSRSGHMIERKVEQRIQMVPAMDPKAAEQLQEAMAKKHVPSNTVRQMMNEAVAQVVFKNDTGEVARPRQKLCKMIDEFNVAQRLEQLESRIIKEATEFHAARKENEELYQKYQEIEMQENGQEGMLDREQMEEIFNSYKDTEIRAAELREFVLTDLRNAQDQEDRLRRNVDEHGNVQKYCAHKREIMESFAEKTKQVGKLVKETITLQFRLDRVMSAALSSHYRKRNMERLQNSSDLTHEAKTAVIDYNVTIDILTFSARINGFINEVEKTLTAQPATQEYREAFVAYMNDVRNQLSEYHWKAKLTQDKTREEKERLANVRREIRLKEREVLFTTGELKKLLVLNKVLQKTKTEMMGIESKSEEFLKTHPSEINIGLENLQIQDEQNTR